MNVGVSLGSAVGVGVSAGASVGLGTGVGVEEGVGIAGVEVGEKVKDGEAKGVALSESVNMAVAEGVRVWVGVCVGVHENVAVQVGQGVSVFVAVGVGLGVSVWVELTIADKAIGIGAQTCTAASLASDRKAVLSTANPPPTAYKAPSTAPIDKPNLADGSEALVLQVFVEGS